MRSIVRVFSNGARRARRRGPTAVTLFGLVILVGGCGGGGRGGDSAVAGGEAEAAVELDALNYEVTPDRYRRWVSAQGALDAISGLREPPTLDPARFTEADVRRAVGYLESDARARTALARAGISARDYVLTTLALDQALVASTPASSATSGAGARPAARDGGSARARVADRASERSAAPSPGAATATGPARTRPRYRNLPPSNAELVARNRDDIARVRSGMRFRIVRGQVDTADVQRAADVAATAIVVPAGTTIALRSDTRVCTNTHKAGDRVTATVTAPVSADGEVLVPAGASASLSVVGARAGGQAAAGMEFTLNSISVDGQTYPVAGTAVASRVDRVRAGSASKDAQKVAGGAAIGAVAGQVLGRDTKSTVIGAAVGAAAGAAAAGASARYNTCVPAGAPIQVTLRDALSLRV